MSKESKNLNQGRPDYDKDNPGKSPEHRRDEENRGKRKERTPEPSHSILWVQE